MKKIKTGYCGICNKKIWDDIFNDQGRVVSRRPNKHYSEFSMILSDESHARHAVCVKCWHELTDTKVKNLFEKIKNTWADDMVGWASDKQFARIRSLTVKVWGVDERNSIKKFKKLKIKEHQQMLKKAKAKK